MKAGKEPAEMGGHSMSLLPGLPLVFICLFALLGRAQTQGLTLLGICIIRKHNNSALPYALFMAVTIIMGL